MGPVQTRSCPNCFAASPRQLSMSDIARVDYFRCAYCGHVWTTDKRTHEIVGHVTDKSSPGQLAARR